VIKLITVIRVRTYARVSRKKRERENAYFSCYIVRFTASRKLRIITTLRLSLYICSNDNDEQYYYYSYYYY